MRAETSLNASDPVTHISGVTRPRAEALARINIHTVSELLRLAPRRYEDRRQVTSIDALDEGTPALVVGAVRSSRVVRARGGLRILHAQVADDSGTIMATWFQRGYTPKPLRSDVGIALFGTPRHKGGTLVFSSPEREMLEGWSEARDRHPSLYRLVPVHPVTRGITPRTLRMFVWHALEAAHTVDDALPADLCKQEGLQRVSEALQTLHFPDSEAAAEQARVRLALDELYVHECRLTSIRRRRATRKGIVMRMNDDVQRRIRQRLPFALTVGQDAAVQEIVADLERGAPMRRLLQGDVGSGKTAVAAYAMLGAVAAGWQVVCMAPTEILARQHRNTFKRLLDASRVHVAYMGRGMRATTRRRVEDGVASGEIHILIGTHAVLSESLRFSRLGLVVVDEQHKFGVHQRHRLSLKGAVDHPAPHVLVMSATPIPRTLAMTTYGDLDVSVIRGRIPGRQPVITTVVTDHNREQALQWVRAALARREQIYVVYPLVEESKSMSLRDAKAACARWSRAFPRAAVGLLHGRLKKDEKEEVVSRFRAGAIQVLVSTVVVEVGVDVPGATMMLIEHAERFGLSQLHQLRGRVGRGHRGGRCLLFDRSKRGATARLQVLAETDDGFVVAEEDLKTRGVGDVLGTRQHGQPLFHAARLPGDLPVLEHARRLARRQTPAAGAMRKEGKRPTD